MTNDFIEEFIEKCDDEFTPSIVLVPCGYDSWRVVFSFGENGTRSTFHVHSNVVDGITDLIISKDNQKR